MSGLTVAANENGKWYRAEIAAVCGSDALAYFLDFGCKKVLNVDKLRYLERTFSVPARKAYKGSLFGVKPKNGDTLWSTQGIMEFMTVTNGLRLMATVKSCREGIYELSIIYEPRQRLRVSNFLVEEGYADICDDADISSNSVMVREYFYD